MNLQIVETDETQYHPIFFGIVEDIPGGVTIYSADLKTTTTELKKGAIIGKDGSTAGLYHVCKTAEVYEAVAAAATEVKVEKEHEFKVGDFITNGQVSTAITAIDSTTSALYDALTITATLDAKEAVPVDTVLYQGSSETSNAAVASAATVEDIVDATLTVSAPRGDANGVTVTISQNGSDALSVGYTLATKTLAIALASTTATKNTAALIQTAIRALTATGGIDFSDWTCAAAGTWDSAALGGVLTAATDYMTNGVLKPAYLTPKYTPYAITTDNLDVSGDYPNAITGAVTRVSVKESLLPFVVHDYFKTLLTDRIQFVD